EVQFIADDSWTTGSFDLVIASSALNYMQAWEEMLARLAGVARVAVFITRLPVVQEVRSFVVLQRAWRYGDRTEYLGWSLNQAEFLEAARRQQLRLAREFLVYAAQPHVPQAPENPVYKGFLFDKESANP